MNEPAVQISAAPKQSEQPSVGKKTPLTISVVVCTYNGARYVAEQLDSILAQTYPIHEIIVQDDNSNDNTVSILRDYAQKDARIRIYNNESGIHGINGNFFSAMRRATGDYIATADQDDVWEPKKLEMQAAAIGDKWLCSGLSVPFSDDGFPVSPDLRIPCYHLIRCTYICPLPGHTMLFRREMLDYLKHGEDIALYYDCQLACLAAAKESIAYVPRPLVNFRRHADAATATKPVGHKLLSSGAWQYFSVSVFHHKKLQSVVRRRFKMVLPFLEQFPFHTTSLDAAKYMSRLQIQRDPVAFFKKIVFFVRHQHCLFYTEERRPVIRFFRAVFFVFSCGYYYRGELKKK